MSEVRKWRELHKWKNMSFKCNVTVYDAYFLALSQLESKSFVTAWKDLTYPFSCQLCLALCCNICQTRESLLITLLEQKMEIFLNDWKTIAEIIQSAATAVAIFVGGIWTYFLFVRNRLDYPKVLIEIEPQEVSIPKKKRLIHAKVSIKNVGKVMLMSTKAELRLRSVVPLPSDIEEAVNEGYDPVSEGNTEVQWPMVAGREWIWKKGEFEIEPDEDDTLHADYIINDSISVVEFYCFIENAKKKQLGWSSTLIHELKKMEE